MAVMLPGGAAWGFTVDGAFPLVSDSSQSSAVPMLQMKDEVRERH